MAQLPVIHVIQASDAPQHTGKLQEIIQNLKAENRIEDFTTLDSNDDLPSLADTIKEEDLILLVLTRQLDPQKEQIENRLKALQARVAEIVVENVAYDNEFLTFPADLRPIRDREDMDAVWESIEQNLKNMFPERERDVTVTEEHLPEWLRGVLKWPWESPGRWHGALFLGLPGAVLVLVTFYLYFPVDFEEDFGFVIISTLFAGLLYAIAGAIGRMRKAPLFFAVAMSVGLMVLFLIFFGTSPDDNIAFAVAFLGPVSAVVGASVGRSRAPFRYAGMVLLGLWPILFSDELRTDDPFIGNLVIIVVVLCLLAWKKPIEPSRAVKVGALPFLLNLAGGFLVYDDSSYDNDDVVFFIFVTAMAAISLGAVYWINSRQLGEDT